jgi:hypothetical protein
VTGEDRSDSSVVSADAARPHHSAPEHARDDKPEPTISEMVAQQIGGVRGIVEASVPVLVFIIVNMGWPSLQKATGALGDVSALKAAIWSAVASAILLALYRLARRDSVKHAVNGLFGVALAAYFANRTGKAEDFYLPGILLSYGEGALFAVSALFRRPVVGYAWSILTGKHPDWREHPGMVRAFSICTLAFTAAFWTNSTIQLVLYYAHMPNALGVARLLGKSLYVGAVVLTVWYGRRVTRPFAEV